MTLEALLDCSTEKLQAMSDEELTSYLSKYFTVTRPKLAKESSQQNNKQNHEQAHRAPPLARDWNSPVQRRLSRAVFALAMTAGNLNDVNIANRLEITEAQEPVAI